MESNITKELSARFNPIALIKTDKKPEDAYTLKPGRGACVMSLVGQTIAKRKTTCFSRENISCGGVNADLGWGTGFETEEDKELQACFLSLGLESAKDKDKYLKKIEHMPKTIKEMFLNGERIYSDYNTAYESISKRPIYDDEKYAVFKPLEKLENGEIPDSVIFTVNPIELTVLIQLNSSFRTDSNYILTPQASACQAIGAFTFKERDSDNPSPVLGPIDFAGRSKIRALIPNNYMLLSMPWKLFLKLEEISKNSVLQTSFIKKFLD